MENVKNFYKNFDESREISIGAIGTMGTIGNFGTIGKMGTIRSMGTMGTKENGKISFRTLMKVEKYLKEI